MASRIKLRRDSATNWTSVNPTLSDGEVGLELDTYRFKVGSGSLLWNQLPYYTNDPFPYIGTAIITGSLQVTGSVDVVGEVSAFSYFVPRVFEPVIISSAPSATTTFDVISGSVAYYTSNTTQNWTLNIRGNVSTTLDSIMSTGQSITVAVIITNGATPYYQSGFQIDGSSVTPKWLGGVLPSDPTANANEIYSFSVVKTATNTFTVFASKVQFV